jgi:hypothetical protein
LSRLETDRSTGATPRAIPHPLPPPGKREARATLPAGVRRGLLEDIDWNITLVAAFSFLAHFLAVAVIYSDWSDPVVDDDRAVALLIESVDELPAPPVLERPRAPASDATDTRAQTPGRASKAPGHGAGARGHERASGTPHADARAAEIASQLAALEVETIIGLGRGVATREVLGSSEVPVGLLDEQGRNASGVREADDHGLRFGGRGTDAVRPGQTPWSIADASGRRGRVDATRVGDTVEVRGPKGGVDVAPPRPTSLVSNADAEVARMRPRFRHCYQSDLDEHPEMEGSITLTAKLGPNGEVLSVSGGGGSLAPIVRCLKAVVFGANFVAPEGGAGALVVIPIRFYRQR